MDQNGLEGPSPGMYCRLSQHGHWLSGYGLEILPDKHKFNVVPPYINYGRYLISNGHSLINVGNLNRYTCLICLPVKTKLVKVLSDNYCCTVIH